MKRSHINIPIFIPHLGCPNMCVFCNQRAISGVSHFIPEMARAEIEKVLSTVRDRDADKEIAFFGGSFTGIERELMITLLDLAESYVSSGEVCGIRMSTRPDYVSEEIVEILKRYSISAVELGVQSYSDKVLSACKRGHKSESTMRAFELLYNSGIKTVGQMMIGLPESSREDEICCAEEICLAGASAARIYPTIVFKDTELYDMTLVGSYTPLELEEAISRSADVLEVFVKNGVDCLRIGLCDSENLHSESTYFAGPNHPSLGELVYSEIYSRIIMDLLDRQEIKSGSTLYINVPKGDISVVVGQNSRNIMRIKEKYRIKNVKFVENPLEKRYNITLELK